MINVGDNRKIPNMIHIVFQSIRRQRKDKLDNFTVWRENFGFPKLLMKSGSNDRELRALQKFQDNKTSDYAADGGKRRLGKYSFKCVQ